jgi:putative RNA 2'-phosphotransferase
MKKKSKLISKILRHKPEMAGLTLDSEGWVSVDKLLKGLKELGSPITIFGLKDIVDNNDKKRFAFSDDMKMIRANQGHSVNINLNYDEVKPPDVLFHGTVEKFIRDIHRDGLKKMNRHHVHLSSDIKTAELVGSRRGIPLILAINTNEMHRNGHKFYLSDNNVWLTERVPSKYIFNFNCIEVFCKCLKKRKSRGPNLGHRSSQGQNISAKSADTSRKK